MASFSSTRRPSYLGGPPPSLADSSGRARRVQSTSASSTSFGKLNSTESRIVYLVETLTRHVLAQGGGGDGVTASLMPRLLRLLGNSFIQPLESAKDEFTTIHYCKRKVVDYHGGELDDGGGQRGTVLSLRLDELHRVLRSPAHSSMLRNRWATLYLLMILSQLEPGRAPGGLEAFVLVDLPYEDQTRRGGADPSTYSSPSSILRTRHEGRSSSTHGGGEPASPETSRMGSFRRFDRSIEESEIFDSPFEEATLLRDLLFVFQGIDGQYIKYDEGEGGQHVLDSHLTISPGKRDLVLQLAELGWLFRKVSNYAQRAVQSLDDLGLVGQAFCFSLQDELTEYYRLIAVLESHMNEHSMVQGHGGPNPDGLTLRRLAPWVEDPLARMRRTAILGDSLHRLRGGALASALYLHSYHGDPQARKLVQNLLARVCSPIFEMIRRWLEEGELVDHYNEFFVEKKKPEAPVDQSTSTNPNEQEMLWHNFTLQTAMLPRFINRELGQKILVTGKAINFMRCYCNDREWVGSTLKRKVAQYNLTYRNLQNLQKVVDSIAEVVNQRLIYLLFERYQLRTHLQALKKFMLLGQGDFVTCLMDMIGPELSKVSSQLYRHDLTGKLEGALRSSNAQYESPDILNRLGVKLMEQSSGEDGWDVFSLHYHVEAPISAIIHSRASKMYSQIFHLLWKIKRVEWCLSDGWKGHMSVAKKVGLELPNFKGLLHCCNMARGQMVHFVSNLSNFMMFEVLETSWLALQQHLKDAKDMDGIIAAHDEYLKDISDKAVIAEEEEEGHERKKKKEKDLHDLLTEVLNMIMDFCKLHFDICTETVNERKLRKDFEEEGNRRTAAGQWGMTTEERERLDARSLEVTARYNKRVQETTANYHAAFKGLLEMLQKQELTSDVLRFLTFRLDFNEYFTARARREWETQREREQEI